MYEGNESADEIVVTSFSLTMNLDYVSCCLCLYVCMYVGMDQHAFDLLWARDALSVRSGRHVAILESDAFNSRFPAHLHHVRQGFQKLGRRDGSVTLT